MASRMERKKEIPCKSLPNLCTQMECESESSLNPYALEFVPSFMKNSTKITKSEGTSTTTLAKREIVGDAAKLNTQSQLFELLHQLGDPCMPLKAIKVSLALDGKGVNIQFKADDGVFDKHLLDESHCQDAALNLELGDRTLMPRKLPNVLAANFMVRMGDILHNKMEWNDQTVSPTRSKLSFKADKYDIDRTMSNHSASLGKDMHKVHNMSSSQPSNSTKDLDLNKIPAKRHRLTLPRTNLVSQIPAPVGDCNDQMPPILNSESLKASTEINTETNNDKKVTKGVPTPRRSLGHIIKKGLTGTQKFAPRSTFTSQMRQTEAQKRLSLLKTNVK